MLSNVAIFGNCSPKRKTNSHNKLRTNPNTEDRVPVSGHFHISMRILNEILTITAVIRMSPVIIRDNAQLDMTKEMIMIPPNINLTVITAIF